MFRRFFKQKNSIAEDPVCGMDVHISRSPGGVWEYRGQPYYFCGLGCNRAFQKDPVAYLSGRKKLEM